MEPINACLRLVIQVMKETIEGTQHLASNHKYNGTTTRSLQTTEMKEQYRLLGLARKNTGSKRHGTGSVSLESGSSTAHQVIYQPLLDPKTTGTRSHILNMNPQGYMSMTMQNANETHHYCDKVAS
eukprot:TRINITY_DN8843_c1_g5_i1.p1 TRINITY_DN8843_c1_g5~~TRINITY_DN8843_c1_g5_i1.p1  ORF type:complete len:126 (+),score=25.28 TRINITY_DN8843_c1_g5_i1:409-786(+)